MTVNSILYYKFNYKVNSYIKAIIMKDINKATLHFKDDYLQKWIKNNLISFNDDNTRIFYNVKTKKNYNYKESEEKVRAYIFIKLILDYGYNMEDIDFEVTVPE